MATWGIKCARTYVRRAQAQNIAAAKFSSTLTVQSAERTCSKKTACLNILCLLSMVLKTRGLSTSAIFMRGSYVVEPCLLAWLRGHSQTMKSTTGSEYT